MVYFAKVSLRIREYMCDDYLDQEKFHTVEADTEHEASEKITSHYENIGDPYGTYYSSVAVSVFEHII